MDLAGWGAIAQGAGSVFDYFAGAEDRERQSKLWDRNNQLYNMLQQYMQQPGIGAQQISSFAPQLQKSMAPHLNQLAGGLSKRLDLDSSVAKGEIARQSYGGLQQLLAQLQEKAMFYNADRKTNLLGMMTQLGRG